MSLQQRCLKLKVLFIQQIICKIRRSRKQEIINTDEEAQQEEIKQQKEVKKKIIKKSENFLICTRITKHTLKSLSAVACKNVLN